MKKTKPCKGSNKAIGNGCNKQTDVKTRKYGLCRTCFLKWLKTPEGIEHAQGLAKLQQRANEKKKLQEWTKRKTKIKNELKTVQDWIKEVQKEFNHYIRLRDKGKVCISCQKPPKKINAGHFYNANNHWNVRFNEYNVHIQCEYCNTYLSGNLTEYRINLEKKIGKDRLEYLDSIARETRNFTKNELQDLKEDYKEKIKMLR